MILHSVCYFNPLLRCCLQVHDQIKLFREGNLQIPNLFAVLKHFQRHLTRLVAMIIILEAHCSKSALLYRITVGGEERNIMLVCHLNNSTYCFNYSVIERDIDSIYATY
ncbi:hypothetical protein D3C73_1383680 [compost metagenome]